MSKWDMPLDELYEGLGDGAAKTWADEKVTEVERNKRNWICLNLLSWLFLIAFVCFNPAYEEWHVWFSRAGSLISLLSVLIEYNFLIKFNEITNPNKTSAVQISCVIYVERKFADYVKYSKLYTVLVLIFGTVIWGYGDLIYLTLQT